MRRLALLAAISALLGACAQPQPYVGVAAGPGGVAVTPSVGTHIDGVGVGVSPGGASVGTNVGGVGVGVGPGGPHVGTNVGGVGISVGPHGPRIGAGFGWLGLGLGL